MAFTKILPPVKEVKVKNGTAMIRVSVAETRKGNGKLRTTIILADTMLTSLPSYADITHVCVYEGTEDDHGKLRIEFAKPEEEGALKFVHFNKGGARIILSANFAAMPKRTAGVSNAKLQSSDDAGFTIELPMEAWAKAGVLQVKPAEAPTPAPHMRSIAGTAKTAAMPAAEPLLNILGAPIPVETGTVVKPIDYLKKKGIRLSKLANDFWLLDETGTGGERTRINHDELLAVVNKHRTKSNLPKIAKFQLAQEIQG